MLKDIVWKSNDISGERAHQLDIEELEYSYDLSDSTSEDEIPDFSSINPYSFEPIQNLSRSPSLSYSSDASMEERKAGAKPTNWK